MGGYICRWYTSGFIGCISNCCFQTKMKLLKRLTMEDREVCFSLGVLGTVIGAIGLIVHFTSQGV